MSKSNGRPRTLHEHMALIQYVYRMKPVGPHMRYVHEILAKARETCPACAGSGWDCAGIDLFVHEYNTDVDAADERLCPECEGTGGFWICSEDTVEILRRRILEVYPEAALEHSTPRFVGYPLQYNYGTGVVELVFPASPEVMAQFRGAWQWTYGPIPP